MPTRSLPVCPDPDALEQEAVALLAALRAGDVTATQELAEFHPAPPTPGELTLDDARLVLARSYQAPNWKRIEVACELVNAIWRDDLDTVRRLVTDDPSLLHEDALIRRNSNWGPPLTYAANVGRDGIIRMLHERGATDLRTALGRALLQSKIGTARMLHEMLGRPVPPAGALGGAAYTLSASGTALVFEFGARAVDDDGRSIAPVDVVLETDSRNPSAKHSILEMYAKHGCPLPDTPAMALHRGRIDLLEQHLRTDPSLLERTFTYAEIFPPSLGCRGDEFPRTSLEGATLLHMCVEFDELDIARWLLARGMSADAPAANDADGFGGHTALFSAVVCYANFWGNYGGKTSESPMTKLLLEHGANPNARASMRERTLDGNPYERTGVREHHDITPLEWGRRFHNPIVVNRSAMEHIQAAGGI